MYTVFCMKYISYLSNIKRLFVGIAVIDLRAKVSDMSDCALPIGLGRLHLVYGPVAARTSQVEKI